MDSSSTGGGSSASAQLLLQARSAALAAGALPFSLSFSSSRSPAAAAILSSSSRVHLGAAGEGSALPHIESISSRRETGEQAAWEACSSRSTSPSRRAA